MLKRTQNVYVNRHNLRACFFKLRDDLHVRFSLPCFTSTTIVSAYVYDSRRCLRYVSFFAVNHARDLTVTCARVTIVVSEFRIPLSFQNSAFTWVRDHILHHKYSDTDADPHNASRGFFFSHIGWLLVKRHPLLLEKQRQIDVSDLRADKLIMFQYK